MIPDETIDRAAEAFHQALGTHMDYAGASCCRADDWCQSRRPMYRRRESDS